MNNVQEVFGQFATKINGNIKMFATEAEAVSAAVLEEREAEFVAKAVAFTEANELEGKQAKTQQNVIVAYLAWEVSGADVADVDEDTLAV